MKKNAKKKATWTLTSADLQKQAEKFGVDPKDYATFPAFMAELKKVRDAVKDGNLATLATSLKSQTKSERKATAEAVLAKVATQVTEAENLLKVARKSKSNAEDTIAKANAKLEYWNGVKAMAKAEKKSANQTIRSANQTKTLAKEFRKEFKTIAKSIDALATV